MKKEIVITIQNLFNGDVIPYTDQQKAKQYIELCLQREIPITINYMYSYVN